MTLSEEGQENELRKSAKAKKKIYYNKARKIFFPNV